MYKPQERDRIVYDVIVYGWITLPHPPSRHLAFVLLLLVLAHHLIVHPPTFTLSQIPYQKRNPHERVAMRILLLAHVLLVLPFPG